ncbi:MAG: site-specific integrase [Prevotella sp.]|jgi:site-specific recombinase XerD|nr:site-specific integrase [Prevotella sp.]
MRYEKISKKKQDAPVVVQIYRDGEKTQKTIFRIKPEYWDEEKQQVRKSHPNSTEKNLQIKKAIIDCEELAFNTVRVNAESGVNQIRNNIHQKASSDFFEFVDFQLEELENKGSISLYFKDKAIMKKFEIFLGKRKLPINKFNSGLINRYEKYLLTEIGNCRNTVTSNMKRLSKYLRLIYKKYRLDITQFPFQDYKMITEKTERCYLSLKELSQIIELEYTPNNERYDAREIFLFESLTGTRIGDILKLKWRNYNRRRLSYIMDKTDLPMNIKLGGLALDIVNRRLRKNRKKNKGKVNSNDYIFNVLPVDIDIASNKEIHRVVKLVTAKINSDLKDIATEANINKNISTHVGRHSFATQLISAGVDIYTVSKLLGHTDVKTTMIYAKVEQTRIDNAMDNFNKYITK